MNHVIIVMGVSGSGKSTVGLALAQNLGATFFDGDDFHPPANVAKMASGEPLDDIDRHPWLASLHRLITEHYEDGRSAVIACSALKQKYRNQLRGGLSELHFVLLDGSFEQIQKRMEARSGHFMKADMLRSQFDTLERPSADEAIIISIDHTVGEIVATVIEQLES